MDGRMPAGPSCVLQNALGILGYDTAYCFPGQQQHDSTSIFLSGHTHVAISAQLQAYRSCIRRICSQKEKAEDS